MSAVPKTHHATIVNAPATDQVVGDAVPTPDKALVFLGSRVRDLDLRWVEGETGIVLQFRGRTSPYLEPAPGLASLDIFRMLREGLLADVRAGREPDTPLLGCFATSQA